MYCIQSINNTPTVRKITKQFSPANVWIQIHYAGLCRTDVMAAKGIIPVCKNRILGHECSGIVVYAPANSSLKKGMPVTINPLYTDGFLGLDMNGAFAEFMEVPESMVLSLPSNLNLQKAAFTEPVAAALAVMNCDITPKDTGLVLGKGRIAALTFEILKNHGFTYVQCSETITQDNFDFIIETNVQSNDIMHILSSLRKKGILILKSRTNTNIDIPTKTIVEREIRIQGAHYGSFIKAIQLLQEDSINCQQFFGPTHSLQTFTQHFEDQEEHKIFCSPLDIGAVCAES